MAVEKDGWQVHVALVHLYRDAMRIVETQTGLSQTRMELMHELFHADEISQSELQQRVGVEGAVITRILKQLESMGLVTRRADPNDNRYTLVSLSKEARANHNTGDSKRFRDTYGAMLMQGMSDDDRATLLRLLGQLGDNVEAIRGMGNFMGE